jgi:hypothetical protein
MTKENTINTAKKLAASVRCAPGFSIDVGQHADTVTVNGREYSAFVRTFFEDGTTTNLRVFKTRAAQCEFLRDVGGHA